MYQEIDLLHKCFGIHTCTILQSNQVYCTVPFCNRTKFTCCFLLVVSLPPTSSASTDFGRVEIERFPPPLGSPALIVAWTSVRLSAIEYAPRWWELKDVLKAQLDSTQPSLTEVFKLRPGEWQCGSCLTRNTARAVKQCASCSANKCAAASRQ